MINKLSKYHIPSHILVLFEPVILKNGPIDPSVVSVCKLRVNLQFLEVFVDF